MTLMRLWVQRPSSCSPRWVYYLPGTHASHTASHPIILPHLVLPHVLIELTHGLLMLVQHLLHELPHHPHLIDLQADGLGTLTNSHEFHCKPCPNQLVSHTQISQFTL